MKKENLLNIFVKEVISLGPEKALPHNLSDKWLDIMEGKSNEFLERDKAVEEEPSSSLLLAVVISILFAKNGYSEVEILNSELFDKIQQYCIEISAEVVSRKTDIWVEPATLETIFTNRNIKYSPKELMDGI